MTQYSRYGSAKGTTWAYWERIKSIWKRLWVPLSSHVTGIWDSCTLIVLSIRASILFIVPLSRFHSTLRGLICAHLTSTLRCHWDCGAYYYVQGVVPMLSIASQCIHVTIPLPLDFSTPLRCIVLVRAQTCCACFKPIRSTGVLRLR